MKTYNYCETFATERTSQVRYGFMLPNLLPECLGVDNLFEVVYSIQADRTDR